ncbi:MAG TPA: hypothetical protein VLV54_02830 [Thermoanaerobaculia bacterium]|nr:hypothetical protein [Thermoanaerobaculia bacterium]
MPNHHHKDALLVQAVSAFAQGCGDVRIDAATSEGFRRRYHSWIDTKKANGQTPQEVWDTWGPGFLDKFKEIGRRAAEGGVVSAETLTAAAIAVERESECPFCPDKA